MAVASRGRYVLLQRFQSDAAAMKSRMAENAQSDSSMALANPHVVITPYHEKISAMAMSGTITHDTPRAKRPPDP